MSVVYDVTQLRGRVRDLLQNVPVGQLPDAVLDTMLLEGKRQLDRDYPLEISGVITGTGKNSYKLTGILTGWQDGFSVIRSILNPTPDLASDESVYYADLGNVRTVRLGTDYWLQFVADTSGINTGINSGKTATLVFTVQWAIKGIDSAEATTITDRVKNALEYICTSIACMSLGVKAAGTLDSQIDGDLINWQGKQQQYRQMAKDFRAAYFTELGLTPDQPRAVMVRANYPSRPPDRQAYLTHRNY